MQTRGGSPVKVVIPAGGAARRFWPWSRAIPKYMLLLGDRPLLHHALDEAAGAGFESAVLVVTPGHRRMVEEYAEAAVDLLPISVVEQPEPRGIGDAVLRAAAVAGDEFGVLLPDDAVRTVDHWSALRAAGRAALCVREVPAGDAGRFGIAVLEGDRVTRLVEKPAPGTVDSRWAVFGRYWSTAAVLEALETAPPGTGELQLTTGFAAVVPDLTAVRFEGELFDCGTPAAAAEAQARWYRRTPDGAEAEAAWRLPALVDRLLAARVLEPGAIEQAFRAVPRHRFLPALPVETVYTDAALPFKHGDGHWLSSSSQPSMMALMLRQLAPEPGQCVLEVGAATGYNAALLAHLVGAGGRVVSVEIEPDLAADAAGALAGVAEVEVHTADGAGGWPAAAPYDRVIVTCAATDLAPAWLEQLRDGGRLVVPLLLGDRATWSIAFDKVGSQLVARSLESCGFIAMRGALGGPPILSEDEVAQVAPRLAGMTAVAVPSGQPTGLAGAAIRLAHATLTLE